MNPNVNCAYCQANVSVEQPEDFDGHYRTCPHCDERFIYERTPHGLRSWTVADAPCCVDPDCRETELSLGDED
jgi:DNA-directed RNA polymerase subunit RPC12/RpoP